MNNGQTVVETILVKVWKTMKCLEQERKSYFNLLVDIDGQTYSIQELVLQIVPRALNQRGQVYWTGYDGGASVTMNYDYYSEGANGKPELHTSSIWVLETSINNYTLRP